MGRERIAMTRAEIDAFLSGERVARLATVDADGWPAVVPVWFVWLDGVMWVWNLDRAARTARLEEATTRVAAVVDAGHDYRELRGVHLRLEHRFVPDDDVPVEVRGRFGAKYFGMDGAEPVGHLDDHTWLELTPTAVRSWDFRKVM